MQITGDRSFCGYRLPLKVYMNPARATARLHDQLHQLLHPVEESKEAGRRIRGALIPRTPVMTIASPVRVDVVTFEIIEITIACLHPLNELYRSLLHHNIARYVLARYAGQEHVKRYAASDPAFPRTAYVDDSMLKTGKIARGAILGAQGGVWATSSGYTVSASFSF